VKKWGDNKNELHFFERADKWLLFANPQVRYLIYFQPGGPTLKNLEIMMKFLTFLIGFDG